MSLQGTHTLIKPNGDRFEVSIAGERLVYNGRVVFKFDILNKTHIQLRPLFPKGDGNAMVSRPDPLVVVLNETYEEDGEWQLIVGEDFDIKSASKKPTKRQKPVSIKAESKPPKEEPKPKAKEEPKEEPKKESKEEPKAEVKDEDEKTTTRTRRRVKRNRKKND